MSWRTDKKEFALRCKHGMNRWYDDFTVTAVEVIGDTADEWQLSIMAFHNTIGAWIFGMPNIILSKAMLRDLDAMIIWELLHVMIRNAHEHLMKKEDEREGIEILKMLQEATVEPCRGSKRWPCWKSCAYKYTYRMSTGFTKE